MNASQHRFDFGSVADDSMYQGCNFLPLIDLQIYRHLTKTMAHADERMATLTVPAACVEDASRATGERLLELKIDFLKQKVDTLEQIETLTHKVDTLTTRFERLLIKQHASSDDNADSVRPFGGAMADAHPRTPQSIDRAKERIADYMNMAARIAMVVIDYNTLIKSAHNYTHDDDAIDYIHMKFMRDLVKKVYLEAEDSLQGFEAIWKHCEEAIYNTRNKLRKRVQNEYNGLDFRVGVKSSDYVTEGEQFKDCVQGVPKTNQFSVLHHNIQSLPAHKEKLKNMLTSLNFPFTCIGFSETWLCDYGYDLSDVYTGDGYSHVYNNGRTRRRGVSLLIRPGIEYIEIEDLYHMEPYLECLFVELKRNCHSGNRNVVVGVIYHPSGQNRRRFTELLDRILEQVTNFEKPCYLLGDFNIDLLKSESKDFLDIMTKHKFVTLINRPTRVQNVLATLIDNIFTDDSLSEKSNHINGIIKNTISDHYPVFHINYD